MPELPVKENRLSELHLPEIKREDIVRSLSEIRLPDVDLSKIERPKFDLPDSVSKFDWPKIDLPSMDIGKAVAGAAAAAHIGRKRRRPRWPLAVGALVVGSLAAWAILTNEMLRARLAEAVQAIRERVAAMRSSASDDLDVDADDPVAFVAAETIPIETAPYADDAMTDATPFVEGIGASHEDVSPALEEMGVRD